MKGKMLCGNCGKYSLEWTNLRGESFSYKEHQKVELKVDFYGHKCRDYGNISIWSIDYPELDRAIEESLEINK